MQTRTLFALVAAALVLATGAVSAQEQDTQTTTPNDGANADTTTTTATPQPATTDAAPNDAAGRPKPADRPAYERPGYHIGLTPPESRMKQGGSVTLVLHADSRVASALAFDVRAPDALRVELSSATISVTPGEPARAKLVIASAESTPAGSYHVMVIAKDENGIEREARARVHVLEARPVVDERPDAAARLDAYEKRAQELERRLETMLLRLDGHLARLADARPDVRVDARVDARPDHRPEPAPGARMMLANEHAQVGPGGGRVALLFQGGDHPARVHLAPRYDQSSGWKIHLERNVVPVPAHERAWIWVELTPPRACSNAASDGTTAADCAFEPSKLEYAIVQVDTPGPHAVKGTATSRMP